MHACCIGRVHWRDCQSHAIAVPHCVMSAPFARASSTRSSTMPNMSCRRVADGPGWKGRGRVRPPRVPTDDRVEIHHERRLRRLESTRQAATRMSAHITLKSRLICVHTAAGVRKAESEHMVHWGRCCCGAPCSRIVRIRALVQCALWGASSPPAAEEPSRAARSWEPKK
jgi:hypothetical protein